MSQVNDNTEVTIPIRNLIALVAAVAIASWTYAGINERLNIIEHTKAQTSIVMDLNTEFRIKWPRGELGSLPADSEQFLLIESLLGDVEYIQLEIKESRHNAVNINRLQKDVDKILAQIEILKDKVRSNGNSSHD